MTITDTAPTTTVRYRIDVLRNLRRVFAGYDAGHFTLPADAVELRAAHAHLTEQRNQLEIPDTARVRTVLHRQVADAALARTPLPAGDTVVTSLLAEQAHAALIDAIDTALGELEYRLLDALDVDTLIVEHLRPALADVVDAVTKLLPVLDSHTLDLEPMLAAPAKVRTAFQELRTHAVRYEALRAAQRALALVEPTERDELFVEMRNPRQIRPNPNPMASAPWPTDTGYKRLAWLVGHGADLWMPTAMEQDALFDQANTNRGKPPVHPRRVDA